MSAISHHSASARQSNPGSQALHAARHDAAVEATTHPGAAPDGRLE